MRSPERRAAESAPSRECLGPTDDRAETVTLLIDLCIFSPAALVDPSIRWESVDERSVRATHTVDDNIVDAVLAFNDHDGLVHFVSDDRMAMAPDGSEFTQQRWSTPLRGYRNLGPQLIWTHGEGRWHPDTGDYPYFEGELLGVEVNPVP